MTRILIHGGGRMARRVLANLTGFEEYELVGLVSPSRPDNCDLSIYYSSLEQVELAVDLLIDFTLPGGTATAALWCETNKVAMISGTTGLADTDIAALKNAALKVPVLWAPNLSQGVALMSGLVRQSAGVLGRQADITIHDIHHQHKLDAPSGTALALALAAREGQKNRQLIQGSAEPAVGNDANELTFTNVREGEVIGEHTVTFVLDDEVIEITHKALHRDVFAKGALKAGEWLLGQMPGYYSTNDWLALNS
jgi:4-hydroxy-tetrahydrodipicolinate reductase